jgi:hypothetical protein
LGAGFKIHLFVLSKRDAEHFSQLSMPNRENLLIVKVSTPLAGFLEGLDPAVREAIYHARAVINFVGSDFSRMKVTARGEEWSIDTADPAQSRFSFTELILGNFLTKGKVLWFNLGLGRHERTPTGEIFCNTKYGLTGLGKAFELTPKLSNIEVISICLTYLHKGKSRSSTAHCAHCVTEELSAKGQPLTSQAEIPNFLLSRIGQLWENETSPR